MELISAIKDVVHAVLASEPSVKVMYATYTGSAFRIDALPLDVPIDMVDIPPSLQTVDAKISCELTEGEGVEITGGTGAKKIKLTDVPVKITRELKAGDHVTVVRHYGGQRFSVLDKI